MTAPPTLLCTATFPANTGFAWDFIEMLYARMADRLTRQGVRTVVAYPEMAARPATLAGSTAEPVVLDTLLQTASSRARFVEFIRKENVRVVYFTDRQLWSVWYPSLRRAGVRRIIVHDHTSGERDVPTGFRRAIKRFVVNLPGFAADVIVAVSNFVAERDRATTLIEPNRIRRVWNGIDTLHAEDRIDLPDVRSLIGIPPHTPLVATACRATSQKGVDVLFKAFDRIAVEMTPSPVLVYIGTGPQLEALKTLRSTLSSAAQIHILGYLPGAADLIRTANVCVVPSVWQEAFGLTVLEMMTRGRAVVASKVGGIPEMIEQGESGLLFPPGDVDALAERLQRVLTSPELQRKLGAGAKTRARSFTMDQQISQMIATFADIFDPTRH